MQRSNRASTMCYFILAAAFIFASVIGTGRSAVTAAPGDLLRTYFDPSPSPDEHFGYRVGGLGGHLLVSTVYVSGGDAYLMDTATGEVLRTFPNPHTEPVDDENYYAQWMVGHGDSGVLVDGAYADTGATNAGEAYLFDANTGNLLTTFVNPSPSAYDHFGNKFASVGSNVLIGSPYDDDETFDWGTGIAYLFDTSGPEASLLTTFHNPDPNPPPLLRFGIGVGALGDHVLISGSDHRDEPGVGAAYLFDSVTGDLLRTYANPVAGGYNNFGENIVGVAGNVVVSAYTDDSGGNNAGAAYLFNGATEELIAVLQQDPAPVADAMFGWSLAVVGNTVAIGSRSGTTPVQVFNGKTGEFLYSLSNPGAADDDFGRSIAAVGSTIAVGAMLCDASGEPNAGAAYLFEAPEPSSALLLLMAATALGMRRWVGKRVER